MATPTISVSVNPAANRALSNVSDADFLAKGLSAGFVPASAEGFDPSVSVAAAWREAIGLSPTTFILEADRTGTQDATNAFNAAVARVQALGGGVLWVPKGTYKIDGGSTGVDGYRNGIVIPQQTYSGSAFQQTKRVRILFEPGAILVPGRANVIVMKVVDQFSIIDGASWQNPNNYASCWAYAVAPLNLLDTGTRILTDHNKLLNYNIQGYDEGIVYQVGPTVGGAASNCYYNLSSDGQINNTKRGIWFKDGVVGSQGANRNWIVRPRIGNGVNTGIQIDAADTIVIDAPVFEGISTAAGGGTSPNTTPTALVIATGGPVTGWECYEIKVLNAIAEACERDLDCGNDDATFTNCTFDFENKAVFGQTPEFYSGNGYNPSTGYRSSNNGRGFAATTLGRAGLFGDQIDIEASTEVTLEARETGSGAVATIRAKTTAGNAVPEVRLDTNSTSGYFSFFRAGVLKWLLGAIAGAGGTDLPTFFDGSSNPMFRVDTDNIRVYNSKTPASSAAPGSAGTICWDSDNIYVCVGANSWKKAALSTI